MPIRAVVFDLDDTLCDWEAGMDSALARLCDTSTAARFKHAVREHAWLRVDGAVLSRRHWMTRRDPTRFFLEATRGDRAAAENLAARYVEELAPPLFADSEPTLRELNGQLPLALLSNAPAAIDRAERLGILGYFSVAASAPRDALKPERAGFDSIAEELGIEACDIAYVGDDPLEDVGGAMGAGMVPIWLDRIESTWVPPSGTQRITALSELTRLIGSFA